MCRFIALPSTLLVCLLLAACVHTGSQTPATSVKYTLAVLPWNIHAGHDTGVSQFDVTMDAFQYELARSAFVPTFSYYDLQESTTTIQDKPGIESVWGGRGVMSKPNQQMAFELGEQLGVDAVITYAVAEQWATDYLFVYLFDVQSKSVYSGEERTEVFAYEAPIRLMVMTNQVF